MYLMKSKEMLFLKSSCLILICLVLVFSLSISAFAYGSPVCDQQTAYFIWIVMDDIPRLFGANCLSTLTQYAMIAGQYIGFHEAYLFAYADPVSGFDDVDVNCSMSVQYYKGSTSLGSTSLSFCNDPIWLDPDWFWDYHNGNANGLLGTGQGTYYAKSASTYYVENTLYGTRIINNSASFTVN
jgi:hypothetical protein